MAGKNKSNGATLDFQSQLWAAADKLRGHMDASEYKHVVLGLIFLKYISDSFEELHTILYTKEYADPKDRDEYLAQNVFWVPKEACWSFSQGKVKQPEIWKTLDDAMTAIDVLEVRNLGLNFGDGLFEFEIGSHLWGVGCGVKGK